MAHEASAQETKGNRNREYNQKRAKDCTEKATCSARHCTGRLETESIHALYAMQLPNAGTKPKPPLSTTAAPNPKTCTVVCRLCSHVNIGGCTLQLCAFRSRQVGNCVLGYPVNGHRRPHSNVSTIGPRSFHHIWFTQHASQHNTTSTPLPHFVGIPPSFSSLHSFFLFNHKLHICRWKQRHLVDHTESILCQLQVLQAPQRMPQSTSTTY